MKNKELITKIASLNIKNYGVYGDSLISLIEEKPNAECLVIALNNIDTDGAALKLLESKAEGVFGGAKYLAEAIGVTKIILMVPPFAAEKAPAIEAEASKNGVCVEVGIVDRRLRAKDLYCHLVTVLELYEALNGTKEEGVYVCVNGGDFKKVPANTALRALVGDSKGVRTGNIIRNAKDLDLTVSEAEITNGVVNAISSDDCVVALVAEKLLADRKQSCGKCVFCREGLLQLEAMAKDMTIGRGKIDYLALSEEIGEAMGYSTPCSMGQNSATLPLSAIKAFPEEFEAHIKKKKCPADFCKAFRKVYIDPTACVGCTKCMKECPVDAIDGAEGYIHIVFDNACTKCGKCVDVCPNGSIHVTTGSVPRLPMKMMRVGRFKSI